jgi:hypothetical protein
MSQGEIHRRGRGKRRERDFAIFRVVTLRAMKWVELFDNLRLQRRRRTPEGLIYRALFLSFNPLPRIRAFPTPEQAKEMVKLPSESQSPSED